ncbi:MAG: class I SAM-dependent methyltransferase [Actinomycetota bacterium]
MKPEFAPWTDPVRSKKYFETTADRPAHGIFDILEPHLPPMGRALDLGCGAGRGTLRLLSLGFDVTAVDMSDQGLEFLRQRLPKDAAATLICSSFQDLKLEGRYDVVVAVCSLFFLPPPQFATFWPTVVEAIVPGGLFAGLFLGVNDSWKDRTFTLHDRHEVESLLSDFEIVHLVEDENDGETAIGEPKHWHTFSVVAKKLGHLVLARPN